MSNILLCVTGGIAVYKAVGLINPFRDSGHNVRVVMTEAATKFVSPLTFHAMSGNPVYVDDFAAHGDPLSHIELAKWADILVIAPATADTIAKYANGIADNLLTSMLLAATSPVLVCPAMNGNMYSHPATVNNLNTLQTRGCHIQHPDAGKLACGDVSLGRLADLAKIISRVESILNASKQAVGLKFLITAGPTVEAIDPARYISNRSSGKMGYALASVVAAMGGEVKLISGKTALQSPTCETINVTSAADMLKAVQANVDSVDILIMAAAVADYTVKDVATNKIKKNTDTLTIELVKTKDILKEVSHQKRADQIFVGFAAESENLEQNATGKLNSKNLDMIVANDISRKDIGFDVSENEVTIYFKNGDIKLVGKMSKIAVAEIIVLEAINLLKIRRSV